MKKVIYILLATLIPSSGSIWGTNPFKPYKPLREIDYAQAEHVHEPHAHAHGYARHQFSHQ